MSDVLKKIIKHYGEPMQTLKAVEELTELQEVLIKSLTKGKMSRDELLSELADVVIMVDQLMIIYSIEDSELAKVRRAKVTRTIERMEEEQQCQ